MIILDYMECMMKRKSYAKMNLCLNIVNRRDDGYHNQDMVMVPISLFDTVEISENDTMEMTTDKNYLPVDKRNSVIKAINILRNEYHFKENFDIKVVKNIPTRSGMGGGSANAATVIKMLNDYLGLDMSDDKLLEFADLVETDAPFTMYGKPAHVEGIGNIINPVKVNLDFHIFIVKPKKGLSTPMVFKRIKSKTLKEFDSAKVIEALETNNYQMLVDNMGNALEEVAHSISPEIKRIKKELIEFGFDNAIMTGAGSTVFGISQDEDLVNRAVSHFFDKYSFVKKAKVIKDVSMSEHITRKKDAYEKSNNNSE